MRRIMHVLVMLTVLLCGLDFCEPAQAHEGPALHGAQVEDSLPDDRDAGAGKLAHTGHHHCPIAPGDDRAPRLGAAPATAALVFARPGPALHSQAQAPPIQPPTA